MLQVAAILGHGLLDGVPSMVDGLPLTVTNDRVRVGREMLVFMEPYVNVPPKGCALLLRAMDRITTGGQSCIAQQLFLPHVEDFSSTLLLWIDNKFIWIKVVIAILPRLLLAGVQIWLLGVRV